MKTVTENITDDSEITCKHLRVLANTAVVFTVLVEFAWLWVKCYS